MRHQLTACASRQENTKSQSRRKLINMTNNPNVEMDKKTKGAWVIHHARKLQSTMSQDFDAIGVDADRKLITL